MKTSPINGFRKEYFFLSNYSGYDFMWRRVKFKSSEQAFAYAKTFFATDEVKGEWYRKEILKAATPGEAKKLGRRCPIDGVEWDKHKVMYMREIVHAKFRTGDPILVHMLLNTGAGMLIEANDWGDKFWGRVKEGDKWVGLNILGAILMEERGWWSRSDEGRPS